MSGLKDSLSHVVTRLVFVTRPVIFSNIRSPESDPEPHPNLFTFTASIGSHSILAPSESPQSFVKDSL
jgi:hypothetical protein